MFCLLAINFFCMTMVVCMNREFNIGELIAITNTKFVTQSQSIISLTITCTNYICLIIVYFTFTSFSLTSFVSS